MYFSEGLAKRLLRKPLWLYSQISDCVIIIFVFWADEKKSYLARETYLVLQIVKVTSALAWF